MSVAVFSALLLAVIHIPEISEWDRSVSLWIQQFRTPSRDRIMLATTLLGDLWLASIFVFLVMLGLLSLRRWQLCLYLLCFSLGALLSVSIIKNVMARARPEMSGATLNSFSFPSGHACAAAFICGLFALILSYGRNRHIRYGCYTAASLLAMLIAFSRVYLLAHWPSDVLAGLALGYALIVAFAWRLRLEKPLKIAGELWLPTAAACTIVIAYVTVNSIEQAGRYGLH